MNPIQDSDIWNFLKELYKVIQNTNFKSLQDPKLKQEYPKDFKDFFKVERARIKYYIYYKTFFSQEILKEQKEYEIEYYKIFNKFNNEHNYDYDDYSGRFNYYCQIHNRACETPRYKFYGHEKGYIKNKEYLLFCIDSRYGIIYDNQSSKRPISSIFIKEDIPKLICSSSCLYDGYIETKYSLYKGRSNKIKLDKIKEKLGFSEETSSVMITDNDIWEFLNNQIFEKIKDNSILNLKTKDPKEFFALKPGKKYYKKIYFKESELNSIKRAYNLFDIDKDGYIYSVTKHSKFPFMHISLPLDEKYIIIKKHSDYLYFAIQRKIKKIDDYHKFEYSLTKKEYEQLKLKVNGIYY